MPPLSIMQQLRLFGEWAPLLSFGQRYLAETDAHKRVLVIGDALEWLATKSASKLDDQLVELIVDVLKTPQGEKVVRWFVDVAAPAMAAAEEAQS